MRTFRLTTIVLLTLIFALLARQVLAGTDETPRPAQDMLTWGNDYFGYPEWLAAVQEKEKEVTGTWTRPGEVAYKRQSPEFKDRTVSEIDKDVNTQWLDTIMSQYSSYTPGKRCVVENRLIIDMQATGSDDQKTPYVTRYWVWADGTNWYSFFLAVPKGQSNDLEMVAAAIFDKGSHCGTTSKK